MAWYVSPLVSTLLPWLLLDEMIPLVRHRQRTSPTLAKISTSTCRSPLTRALSSSARQHSFPISRMPCVPRQSVPKDMRLLADIRRMKCSTTYHHGGVDVMPHCEPDAKEERASEVQRGEPWSSDSCVLMQRDGAPPWGL